MSEWWTYRPSDFLMFAPRAYWRLFELQNEAWWPAQLVFLLLTLALMVGLWCRHTPSLRAGTAGFALAWVFVAVTFLAHRYAPINWAASGFAWAFGAQALGLVVLALRHRLRATLSQARRQIGLVLLMWATLVHPLLPLAVDRPWMQAEVLGLAPDPTAIATLGLLLAIDADSSLLLWLLRVGAMVWLVASAATLATMGSALAVVPLAAVLLALAAVWWGRAAR
ncbi:DUF6064 family protein [Hydrogenophaga sp.]|uniref:DUF6064 family protein n=1 Tax=Hydrogenophaga sp. TaxID=1904254 RepID=UPI00272CA714|nr:DUF6064 family protein [Hydrogenophaga sp.]